MPEEYLRRFFASLRMTEFLIPGKRAAGRFAEILRFAWNDIFIPGKRAAGRFAEILRFARNDILFPEKRAAGRFAEILSNRHGDAVRHGFFENSPGKCRVREVVEICRFRSKGAEKRIRRDLPCI